MRVKRTLIDKRWLVVRNRSIYCVGRYGVGLAHAIPGGGPVLLGSASWRTVNGLWFNAPTWSAWLLFRRWLP